MSAAFLSALCDMELIYKHSDATFDLTCLLDAPLSPSGTFSQAVFGSSKLRERSFSESAGPSFVATLSHKSGTQVNSTRYKTELCRPYEENGVCKYGEKCQFAHGFHELRSLSRHPKYKTEPCRTFHTIGFCPYGPRCHFIHNAEERRSVPGMVTQSRDKERPRLQHSVSFSGFPSQSGLRSPTSHTPPPLYDGLLLSPLLAQTLPSTGWDSPPSPSGSGCGSGSVSSSGSLSGSESPTFESGRRLPIFSRLSVSDD
ncbi:mRNA decay activator protein ZFP36L2 [Polypterus senegalus]|uniref:mRNA decay activator protein ZFP36L2 n=1 Tax=Polypterus senegalus TaxID=55291 RepID=UPI001962776E|nr:mRNA decay activator protein ZFP36L2 [Polypterus senegalus]